MPLIPLPAVSQRNGEELEGETPKPYEKNHKYTWLILQIKRPNGLFM